MQNGKQTRTAIASSWRAFSKMHDSIEAKEAEARILDFLAALGIDVTLHKHQPVFTVKEAQTHTAHLPGLHVKNMFLKDKNAQLWLITCLDKRKIKIKDLEKKIGARKMSFGKPDLLWETLGVRPGAVTPLALFADRARHRVKCVIDAALIDAPIVNCHPLHNAATIALSHAGLKKFFTATGHDPIDVDFDVLEARAS